ncbi:MAG: pyridoxal 5'-phosphate synthase glutaminase subunit PdxT [Euryarchaeota archaeon]|nr:pyridoxal 5'-phosphate synthase glutaminase subunit PdxT [Euryarchaeota archaeon]
MLKAGVVAVQGAVTEHLEAFERAFSDMGRKGQAVPVRRLRDLGGVQALAIPGGESTTISRLLQKFGLFDEIGKRAREGMPVLGTCAGLVLLSREGDEEVRRTKTRLLGLVDMAVARNAFGRQKESFEADIAVDLPGEEWRRPYPAVFIRAPVVTRVWGGCRALACVEGRIVLAGQGNLVAAAFHPELTTDTRLHRLLLGMI